MQSSDLTQTEGSCFLGGLANLRLSICALVLAGVIKVPAPFLRLCSLEFLPSEFYTGSMGVDPEKPKEPDI